MAKSFVPPNFTEWQAMAPALGLKPEGREFVGPCPSCGGEDRFSVSEKNRRAVFQCRGCNPGRDNPEAFQAILIAAGFADEHEPGALGPPDTTYVYRDPKGDAYHEVYRWGNGSSKVIRQKPGYRGKFYPYRIEHHPDWHDLPIVVVEGEKCADHLARLGYAAVTWCGGAGKETRTLWGGLAGREVVLWADSDASGKGSEAMRTLAGILEGLGCEICFVTIPEGKPDKRDAADATEEEIHRLIETASAEASLAPIEMGGGETSFVMSMGEFLAADLSPPEYLVADLMPTAGLVILSAKPNVGKSTITRSLSMSAARGESFLGRSCKQGPVFYGGFEEEPSFARAHFQAMGVTANDPISPFIKPVSEGFLKQLESWVERERPALVVLDTLSKIAPGVDENSYNEMQAALQPYLAIARTYRTCVLICHHNKKAESGHFADDLLGSTAIRGNADTIIHMKLLGARRVIQTEQRYGPDMPETYLRVDAVTERIEADGTLVKAVVKSLEDDILDTISEHGEPMNKSQIERAVDGRNGYKRKALDRLCNDGLLHSWRQGNATMYSTEEQVSPSPPL